jgi:hypothetical protein
MHEEDELPLYVPAAQMVHAEASLLVAELTRRFPAAQEEQVSETDPLYFPVAQDEQVSEADVLYRPALQSVQAEVSVPVAELTRRFPAAQEVQVSEADALYFPVAQKKHVPSASAPVDPLYFPAEQLL